MKKNTHPYMTRQHMLSNSYEVYHYLSKGMMDVDLHHHDFYECYFLISGDVTYTIEGKKYSLRPGDVVLLNSKELHEAHIHSTENDYERMVLWISKPFLQSLNSLETDLTLCFEGNDKKNVIRTSVERQQSLRHLFNKLLQLERYQGLGKDLLEKVYLVELAVHLNTLAFNHNVSMGSDLSRNSTIDRVIEYINANLENETTLDELSRVSFLSKYYLARAFKAHTGTTIHRFIVQKKLIAAKELILQGHPITEVYKQCGFGDYSNFFRAFKAEYGVTPKQYFESMKKILPLDH